MPEYPHASRVNVTIELPLDVYRRLERRARYLRITAGGGLRIVVAKQVYEAKRRDLD